jgi:hypothetical protein
MASLLLQNERRAVIRPRISDGIAVMAISNIDAMTARACRDHLSPTPSEDGIIYAGLTTPALQAAK